MSSLSRAIAAIGLSGLSLMAGAATVFSEDFTNPTSDNLTRYNPEGSLEDGRNATLPGHYALLSDPAKYFRADYHFAHFYDHTTGTSDGTMLFFDGAVDASPIWYRTASVTAGITYMFSYWMASASALAPPELAFAIGDDRDGTVTTVEAGVWKNYAYSFIAAITGDVVLSIADLNLQSDGNDGAIDDISLTFQQQAVDPGDPNHPVPEPEQAALLAAGLAILAWMTRKQASPPVLAAMV